MDAYPITPCIRTLDEVLALIGWSSAPKPNDRVCIGRNVFDEFGNLVGYLSAVGCWAELRRRNIIRTRAALPEDAA
ncbi:hypothetical protein ACFOGJ_16070 [Marinibaculum pumilum]|uniref:Uncharacterized protein n=1 Tax=Marinibaculum pumilum TaxID=1766165 RepID=A0ABV7L289_9PROT